MTKFEFFDEDGYPTDEALRMVEEWNITGFDNIPPLLELARSLWRWPQFFFYEDGCWYVSTGGWSGNEDVIAALKKNTMFWLLCWKQSTRGGHYVFDVSKCRDYYESIGGTQNE